MASESGSLWGTPHRCARSCQHGSGHFTGWNLLSVPVYSAVPEEPVRGRASVPESVQLRAVHRGPHVPNLLGWGGAGAGPTGVYPTT